MDSHRDARSFVWLDDVRRDVRYALRMLRRSPGFTTVAALTLALGIGATAIFSIVNAVLLHPLPYPSAERLVRLYENIPAAESPNSKPRRIGALDTRDLLELRAHSRTLSHVITYSFTTVTISGCGDAMRLRGAPVSGATFPMLGVQPLIGRWFTPDEERPGEDRVILLGNNAWQGCFARDPNVLGRVLTFTGRAAGPLGGNVTLGQYSVVGIMPGDFHFPDDDAQFWIPRSLEPGPDGRPRRLGAIARLADSVSLAAAGADVDAVLRRFHGYALNAGASAAPPRFELARVEDEVGAPVKPALQVLTVAVAFVLLIACANVANLLLARTASRQREIAVRIALGAGRGRVIRQALTESVLLALLGGVAGTALAYAGVDVFQTLGTTLARADLGTSATFPRLHSIGVDERALEFALLVSIGAGILFGLAPAFRSGRVDQMEALRDGRAAKPSSFTVTRPLSAQGLLVVAEIGMATVLFIGGGLIMRSFLKLTRVDPGYRASNVLTFQVGIPGEQTSARQIKAFADDLLARLRSLPDVQAVAYANQLPTVNLRDTAGGLWRTPDANRRPSPEGPDARLASQDYLKVMGIRVIAGRGFSQQDTAGQPRVLLVNETLARNEFATENPLGQTVFIGRDPSPWTIVGVVADVRQFGLDQAPEPQFFADLRQWPEAGAMPTFPVGPYYAIRTSGNPTSAIPYVRSMVRQLNPQATLDNIATLDQIVANSMMRPRMYAVLLAIFAGVAVGLAAIGIYGVMAYSVSRRTREIGVRIALGARRADVLGLVLRQSGTLTIAGMIIGLAGAVGLSRYLAGLLFAITPFDAATLSVVLLTFAAIAILAAYVPASRATLVDPAVALRCE